VLWSHLFKIWVYTLLVKIQIMKKLEVRVEGGISSRIPDTSLHVTFLDYDNIVDDRLIEELRFLQEEFEIGNFYVLETRNKGRHAVCIDALRPRDQKEIVDFSGCDLMFKKAPRINEYRCWILRYAKKGKRGEPEYLYTVESPYEGQNLQSRGHAKYLEKFGIRIDLKNPYGPEEIEVQDYNTGKRTDLETEEEGDE
jgi:hypothetical protein